MDHLAEDILEFWIGGLDKQGMASAEHQKHWFAKDSEFDKRIANRFGNFLEPAGMGAFDRWAASPRGRVAELILLDQFPRNIFRGQARSFYYDKKAQHLCLEGMRKNEHLELPVSYAYFLLMPTMHAEDLEIQTLGVAAFSVLHDRNEGEAKKMMASALDYAERHRAIIQKFGRFPHRNEALKRESTEEELAFLKQPGSSF